MDSDKSPGLVTLSLAQAAERLKASPGFIGRLVREGEIPACKVGRAWVLREADLSRYLENQIEARAALRRIIAARPGRARRKLPAI